MMVCVVPDLRGQPREALGHHELQLGAVEADAIRAGIMQMRQVDDQAGIDVELDLARRPW